MKQFDFFYYWNIYINTSGKSKTPNYNLIWSNNVYQLTSERQLYFLGLDKHGNHISLSDEYHESLILKGNITHKKLLKAYKPLINLLKKHPQDFTSNKVLNEIKSILHQVRNEKILSDDTKQTIKKIDELKSNIKALKNSKDPKQIEKRNRLKRKVIELKETINEPDAYRKLIQTVFSYVSLSQDRGKRDDLKSILKRDFQYFKTIHNRPEKTTKASVIEKLCKEKYETETLLKRINKNYTKAFRSINQSVKNETSTLLIIEKMIERVENGIGYVFTDNAEYLIQTISDEPFEYGN